MPAFGFTKHGHAVHAHVTDHLPDHSPYARFNKKVALWITENVGTMTCFWIFCVIALLALPAALVEAKVITPTIGIIGEAGFVILVEWAAQSFIQLVLLPALMVGQNLAADARSAKTFEDVERIIDLLDAHTQGGVKDIIEAIDALKSQVVSAAGAGGSGGTGGAATAS
jgi:hypothetical protein